MTPDEQANADQARKANEERVAKERRTWAEDYPATLEECKELFEGILQVNYMLRRTDSPDVAAIKNWQKDEYHPSTKPALKGTWNKAARRLVELQTADTGKPEPDAPAIDSEQDQTQRPSDLVSVVEGVVRAGMANVLNIAARAKADDRCNAAMQELLADRTKAKLKLSEWENLLKQSRKTILQTEAWKFTIPKLGSSAETVDKNRLI